MDTVDLDQLFEEYVETDLLQHCSDPTVERSSSEDLAQLFELSSSNDSAVYRTAPILNRDGNLAWQQAVQKSEQNPALSMSNDSFSFRIDAKGKESHSDSELLNFEDLFDLEHNQLRSYSQPSTPRPYTTKSVKKAVSFHQDRSIARGIHKLSRKTSTPALPKMMQPSFYRSPLPDVWRGKMEATADSYTLRVPPNGITSPPPSSKLVQHENSSGFFGQHHQPYAAEDQSPLASPTANHNGMNFANYQITPQASPAIGVSSDNSNNNDPFSDNMGLAFSSSVSSAALSALQTPPSSMRIPMTTWGPTDTSSSMDFGFSASPDFSATKTAGWWDAPDANAVGPTYRESNQRSTSQFSSNTGSMDGLGITCDSASFGDFGVSGLGISPSEQQPQQNHSAPASFDLGQSSSASAPRQAPSSANVGFVNFTPHDSRKILTGVAPSGSSKTKARREKEAAEKRRKLSQAAMKAVMEAGGDVDSLRRLEREGLLVLEN
ncbi:hypothetical protein DE146DRAFT_610162 [Phaeosphaeria sp. MPI-PUGE-AT-0046c]|nr:hypothetical protein DE146DRAFT_610162 [Phaeosphaeria sp. MPI-PUGE-AT-0046c]